MPPAPRRGHDFVRPETSAGGQSHAFLWDEPGDCSLSGPARGWRSQCQISANLLGEFVVDLSMAGNARRPLRGAIYSDRADCHLPEAADSQLARECRMRSRRFKPHFERLADHICPNDSSSMAVSGWLQYTTASWRFVRASSRLPPACLAPGNSSTNPDVSLSDFLENGSELQVRRSSDMMTCLIRLLGRC